MRSATANSTTRIYVSPNPADGFISTSLTRSGARSKLMQMVGGFSVSHPSGFGARLECVLCPCRNGAEQSTNYADL
jgi:hypothetical protein